MPGGPRRPHPAAFGLVLGEPAQRAREGDLIAWRDQDALLPVLDEMGRLPLRQPITGRPASSASAQAVA